MTLSVKRTAQLAGLFYMLAAWSGAFNLLYVPGQLMVMNDPVETLRRIVQAEMLFRVGIAAGIVSAVLFLVLPVVLHGLLRTYGPTWSALMIAFAAVGVSLALIGAQHYLQVLTLLNGPDRPELAEQVMEQLVAHHQAERLASIFWGLWLLPLGVLILRSRALPRLIGLLLLLGCAGYLVNFSLPLLVPGYAATLLPILLVIPGAVGEGGTWLWLLGGAFRPSGREVASPQS